MSAIIQSPGTIYDRADVTALVDAKNEAVREVHRLTAEVADLKSKLATEVNSSLYYDDIASKFDEIVHDHLRSVGRGHKSKLHCEFGDGVESLPGELAYLLAEIARLKRGEFTPAEFQSLCHHRDERPGCTRAEFETGCREYQVKLFGVPLVLRTES